MAGLDQERSIQRWNRPQLRLRGTSTCVDRVTSSVVNCLIEAHLNNITDWVVHLRQLSVRVILIGHHGCLLFQFDLELWEHVSSAGTVSGLRST